MSDIKFPKDERGVEYYDPAGENNITGGQISDEFEPLLCPICGKNTIGRNQPPECQHTRREIFEYANALKVKLEKWEKWMPDEEDLQELAEQAKSKDGSYANGLAAQSAYIGGLEAKVRQLQFERDAPLAKIEKAKEALRKIADTVNPQEQQDYMTARDCLRKLEEK